MTLGNNVVDKKAIRRFQTLESDFNKIHKFKFDYSNTIYINSKTKIKVHCEQHGDFWVLPSSHLNGVDCKQCELSNRRYTYEEFIKKSKEKYGDKFDYSSVVFVSWGKKVDITCNKHGKFSITPGAHLLNSGGCKDCLTMNYMEFLEKAVEKHSSVFDYSKANYINYKTKITIICKEHGEFQQTPSMHLKSKYCCPQCLVIGRTKKLTMTQTDFILKANAKHNNIYNYTLTNYIKWNIKVDIICNIHGVFSQEANSHLRGHGCPRCSDARTSYSSNYTKYKDKPTPLYYIKISDLYWKIGLTKQTVERRFKKEINSGVKIETIFTKVYEDGWEAYLIEQDAIIETIGYKIQKCDSPILGGWTEIRSVDFINKIKI